MTLILPKGYDEFNKKIELWDGKPTKPVRDWVKEGFTATREYQQESAGQNAVAWVVDSNYCPDCGRKNITQEQQRNGSDGIFHFDEPHPEIEMKPGDLIVYTRCGDCRVESVFEKQRGTLIYSSGDWDRARNKAQLRIQNNLLGWIKSRRMAGESPLTQRQ